MEMDRCQGPKEPLLELTDLKRLQTFIGLGHLDQKEFAERLRQQVIQIGREDSQLALWCRRRASLLEYEISGIPLHPREISQSLVAWTYAITNAGVILRDNPIDAGSIGEQLRREILISAALAALSAFAPVNGLQYSANLMVPMDVANIPQILAFDAAIDLWGPVDGKVLSIICETESAPEHLNFWAPLLRSTNGQERLPGAPSAFDLNRGSAVFKADRPSMSGFLPALASRWDTYMDTNFKEDMFISLPFAVMDGHRNTVIAVLNINVNISDDTLYRAYHREWLEEAVNRAAPFIGLALVSWHLESYAKGNLIPIDTGVASWNYLPGAHALMAPVIEYKADDDGGTKATA